MKNKRETKPDTIPMDIKLTWEFVMEICHTVMKSHIQDSLSAKDSRYLRNQMLTCGKLADRYKTEMEAK